MSDVAALPSYASVVVIGGGVMGCSTLYHLAKEGIGDAILLERNQLTSGTTWHSAAQVRALRSSRNLTDLIRYSISLYSTLEEETGQSTGWINKGSLSIATTEDRLTHIRRQEALARMFGVRAASITADEAKERWPLMNAEDVIGAVWSPDDGRVSPSDLCAALAKGAKAKGARIFEETGVIGLLTKGGRLAGVETSRGTVRCDAVALCAGLWSREIALSTGCEVPVWPCEHFYCLTKPVAGISGNMPTLSDHDSHLYIRDDSGGLLVGCFEPMGKAIDPQRLGESFAFQLLPEDWDHFEPMMIKALHRLPALETAEVRTLLNGPESFTPDGVFLLGETAETRGLFLGCGMNSVGVATGGGAGMALAHQIINGRSPFDLHEVDPKRFPDEINGVAALSARVPEVLGKHYEISYPGRQWDSARRLRTMPLHDKWVEAGAHFGPVFGVERPLYVNAKCQPTLTFGRPDWFDQVGLEVEQAHRRAAIFDQSSLGKIDVLGADACAFLERLCTNRMDRPPGSAVYTLILNERGGIESDLTALRIADDQFRLFVGTAAIKRDMAWLRRRISDDEQVELVDRTADDAIIALMGPKANGIVKELGAPALAGLGLFKSSDAEIAGVPVRAVRLSYVGEPGFEISCTADNATLLYEALHAEGARPAGLYAQTSMRIEKRFLAYGHDLDTDVTPLEAGLDVAIDWQKDFIGRQALFARSKAPRLSSLVTLVLKDRDAAPLGNEPVYVDGKIVGKTTSAAFGYRVDRPLALAYLDLGPRLVDEHMAAEIDIGGDRFESRVCLEPAYDQKKQDARS